MRVAVRFFVVVTALAFVFGCGDSSKKSKDDAATDETGDEILTKTQRPFDRPSYVSPSVAVNPMSRSILDTLRHYKKINNVTRDEAWPGRGGVLANDYFEVWYPEGATMVSHGVRVLNDMMGARARLEEYMGHAPEEPLVILLSPYMDTYKEWTGKEYWHYSELHADSMTMQPLYILIRRGLVDIALPHEYYQWAMGHETNFGAPRWLEEGVASYISSEGNVLKNQLAEFPAESYAMSLDEIEAALLSESDRQQTRIAYYHAYRMVQSIVDRFGDDKLVLLIARMGQGATMDEACVDAFGVNYEQLVIDLASRQEEVQ